MIASDDKVPQSISFSRVMKFGPLGLHLLFLTPITLLLSTRVFLGDRSVSERSISPLVRNVSLLLQVKADGRSHTDKTPSRRRVSWHHLLATPHSQPCHFPAPGSSRPENTSSKDVVCGVKSAVAWVGLASRRTVIIIVIILYFV
jgi:hypothetical protein